MTHELNSRADAFDDAFHLLLSSQGHWVWKWCPNRQSDPLSDSSRVLDFWVPNFIRRQFGASMLNHDSSSRFDELRDSRPIVLKPYRRLRTHSRSWILSLARVSKYCTQFESNFTRWRLAELIRSGQLLLLQRYTRSICLAIPKMWLSKRRLHCLKFKFNCANSFLWSIPYAGSAFFMRLFVI